MPVKVVDASVLAAVLFGEPRAEELSERLGANPLAAPKLVRYEVGRVCLKKLKRYPRQRSALLESLGLLARMGIREVDTPIGEVLEVAEEEGLTIYDASYLWLSRALGAELVTLDARLARAAR